MKFFDVHLHLPTPDAAGLDALLRHLDEEPEMVGGNLILNTREEVDFAYANLGSFPRSLNLVPYYSATDEFPEEFTRSGWYKIHPRLSRVRREDVAALRDAIASSRARPKGVIVHCFPWGPELEYNTSLPLVIELARALPETFVLASHGGGYEAWAFRAHTGMLKNVLYDFSVTMFYYENSDILRPFQRYLLYSRERLVFGSDWPSAGCGEQLKESLRLAREVGVDEERLEEIFMTNARRFWP